MEEEEEKEEEEEDERERGVAIHPPIISPTLLEGIINSTTSCPASGPAAIIKGEGWVCIVAGREERGRRKKNGMIKGGGGGGDRGGVEGEGEGEGGAHVGHWERERSSSLLHHLGDQSLTLPLGRGGGRESNTTRHSTHTQ